MLLTRSLLMIAMIAAATVGYGQSAKAAKIERFVSGLAASGHFSGQVTASENGKVIYDKAFGLANADFKIPNATNTRIGIASVTKPMTSVILFRLIEAGKIKLEDPLSKYIADFPSGDKITINMLHIHRAGIPHRVMPPEMESVPVTSAEMVEKVKQAKLVFEPGTQRLYSSAGFAVLARVLEIVSGKPYAQLLKEYVFAPAEMKDSIDPEGGAVIERRAQDYLLDADGYRSAALKDYSFLVGGGSVYGTATDVHRFGMAMIEGKYGETAKAAWVRDGVFSASGSTNGHRAYVEIKADKTYGFALTSNVGSGAVDIVQAGLKEIMEGREPATSTVSVPKFEAAANPDLSKYTGKYRAQNGSQIEIVSRGGHLFSSDIKLYSVRPGCFFDYRFFGDICFISDSDRIKEIRWKTPTGELTWARQ